MGFYRKKNEIKAYNKNFLIAFTVITAISVFFIYFYNECEEWKNEIHLGFSSESIAQKDITFVNEKISQEKLDCITAELKYDWNFKKRIKCTGIIIQNITILYFYAG